jgi:hypothetical protein
MLARFASGYPARFGRNSQAVETLHQQHGPVAEYGYPDRRDIQSELDQEGQADMFVLHAVDRSIPLGSAPICGLKICVVGVVPSGLCQRSCHQRRVWVNPRKITRESRQFIDIAGRGGGRWRARTADILGVNETLYQLS